MAIAGKTQVRCTVCSHPERHRIELLRLAGTPTDTIVERYPDLKRDAVYRHMIRHVDAETKAAIVADIPLSELAERATAEGHSLIDYFQITRSIAMSAMQRAAAVNDHTGTAALAKRVIEVNQAIGRLTGELLNSAPVRNYTNNTIIMGGPAMSQLETMLLEVLGPFPDALRAVVNGLRALDGPTTPMIDVSPMEACNAA